MSDRSPQRQQARCRHKPSTFAPCSPLWRYAAAAVFLLLTTFGVPAASNNHPSTYTASNIARPKIGGIVNNAIRPLIQKCNIPGMAIAVVVHGRTYFYNYGVASRETQKAVTSETLFEIGSISKTFTATLASYAQVNGNLSLSDNASKYLSYLHNSGFDKISLLYLGTYTSGGLPLQLPNAITNSKLLINYFKNWRPQYAAGTHRIYSNPSIGMLGMIAAQSLGESFDEAMAKKLFPALGMTHSDIHVPTRQMKNYAQGYTKNDVPTRLSAGPLSSEAYGVKSSAGDMIHFVEANMRLIKLDRKWQRAVDKTHTGYFRSGELTQDLVWEQYPYPVGQKRLLAGNSDAMIYQATLADKLSPPLQPQMKVWINKTGSTNGFTAYMAFIPAKKLGIVILANKNYPLSLGVSAAYQILTQLDGRRAKVRN